MRCLLLVPAIMLIAGAADLPEQVPVPTEADRPEAARPSPADRSDRADEDEEAGAADPAAGAANEPAEGEPDADAGPETETATEIPAPAPLDEAEIAACEAELRRLGAVFERRDPIEGGDGCGVPQPYNLRQPAPGVILKPDTEFTCPTALATVRWIQDVVQPSVRALGPDAALSEVTHASTYVCRSRNNQPGAKISEHARGTAIDISGFDIDGHGPIPVVPRAGKGSIEEAFQRAVRAGACLHFTTVLGPGSDAYHDNHLHFDLAERSSGYRLCQ